MSFKLAGTDDPMLSFGYMQSLVFFSLDISDYYKENLAIEKVALKGSILNTADLQRWFIKISNQIIPYVSIENFRLTTKA